MSNAIPTPLDKLKAIPASFVFECSKTLDVDGNPVNIRVKRIPRLELLPIMKTNPYIAAAVPTQDMADMSGETRMARGLEYLRTATDILCAVADEPKFSLAGGDNSVTVEVVDEEDRVALMEAYLRFCGYIADDDASESVARFRDENEGGRVHSEQDSAAGINAEDAQQVT